MKDDLLKLRPPRGAQTCVLLSILAHKALLMLRGLTRHPLSEIYGLVLAAFATSIFNQ